MATTIIAPRTTILIYPKPAEYDYWRLAVITGKGGFQSLARRIKAGLREDGALELPRDAFKRVCVYAQNSDGGFQYHLRQLAVTWMRDNFDEVV